MKLPLYLLFLVAPLLVKSNKSFSEIVVDSKPLILSSSSIFKPLIADPKWPRFTLAYQYHAIKVFGRHAFAPNFGAVLPLLSNTTKGGAVWEFSIHASIFALLDIGSKPSRLINSDYFGGFALAMQKEALDYLIRASHMSSHLGDELLLSPQGQRMRRINLSYETIEAIVAYQIENGFRPYVGLGYIVSADPSSFKSAELTAGFDCRFSHTIFKSYVRPIAGIYSKTSKNYNWNPSLSIKAGLEFEGKPVMGRVLQLLLEYYRGNSIQGQFYKKKESHIGTSLNINF